MLAALLIHSLYIFFIVVEIILMIYVISTWIPVPPRLQGLLVSLIMPVLIPVRILLRHSVFYTRNVDLSPIIALAIITFLQNLFYSLMLA